MHQFFKVMFLIGAIALPLSSGAFGLKTHIFIGQEVYEDIHQDCAVSTAGANVAIPRDVCISIRNHKSTFLAGTLGPDLYPDLITGQVTTHPGLPGGWSTAEWIENIYNNARSGEELAFAAGYLVHAASDTFAHSYVNTYSGDIFDLKDERAVERRHFVLEKYIDSKLPKADFNTLSLKVPAEFVRNRLIYNDDAARQAQLSGAALHMYAMNNVWKQVNSLHGSLESLERDAGKAIADILFTYADVQLKIADGEASLRMAEIALQLSGDALRKTLSAYSLAKDALDQAIKAVEDNKNLIFLNDQRAQAARIAIVESEKAAREANRVIADGERILIGLDQELIKTAKYVTERTCSTVVESTCRTICFFCERLCEDVERETCSVVTKITAEWQNLSDRINSIRRDIIRARQILINSGIVIASKTLEEANSLRAKLEAEALAAGFEAARKANQITFEVEKKKYESALAVNNEALIVVQNIIRELESLRNRLVNLDYVKKSIADLIDNANVLTFYTRNWVDGLEKAGSEYIETSTKVARILLAGHTGVLHEYARWVKCYGSSYTPTPYQFGQFACKAEDFFNDVKVKFDELVYRSLPYPFSELYNRYMELEKTLNLEIRKAGEQAAIEILKISSPDEATDDFIQLLIKPENATISKLNEVYRNSNDAAGKKLLIFDRVSDLIDHDIGVRNGELNVHNFAALKSSITLSKIALLDREGVSLLAWKLGGDKSRLSADRGTSRYSILYDSPRSIDGNHQWQPFGLP